MEDRQSLAHKCAELKEIHAKMKKETADVWRAYEAAAGKLIESMEAEGLQRFEDADLHQTFKIDVGLSFKIRDGEMEAFYDWLESSGNQAVIKRTVHASTRDAVIRLYMEKTGQDVPGIEATPYKVIEMRAVKSKGVI